MMLNPLRIGNNSNRHYQISKRKTLNIQQIVNGYNRKILLKLKFHNSNITMILLEINNLDSMKVHQRKYENLIRNKFKKLNNFIT